MKNVSVDGRPWKEFDVAKEWVKLSADQSELKVTVRY